MARPISTKKQSVNLASGERVSRIRRDPPPAVKQKLVVNPDESERWAVTIGVVAFALAVFIIILAAGAYAGWSPSQYTVHV